MTSCSSMISCPAGLDRVCRIRASGSVRTPPQGYTGKWMPYSFYHKQRRFARRLGDLFRSNLEDLFRSKPERFGSEQIDGFAFLRKSCGACDSPPDCRKRRFSNPPSKCPHAETRDTGRCLAFLCSEDFIDRIVPGGANIPEGSHISGRGLHLKRHSTQDWLIHQKMCTLYRNHV